MYQRLFNNAIPIQNFSLPTDAPLSRGIGSEEFIMRKLNLKLKEIEKDIEIISKLQKVQEQWTFIFYVLTGKLNYLYRTVRNFKLVMPVAMEFEKKGGN